MPNKIIRIKDDSNGEYQRTWPSALLLILPRRQRGLAIAPPSHWQLQDLPIRSPENLIMIFPGWVVGSALTNGVHILVKNDGVLGYSVSWISSAKWGVMGATTQVIVSIICKVFWEMWATGFMMVIMNSPFGKQSQLRDDQRCRCYQHKHCPLWYQDTQKTARSGYC